jgi:Cu-Zn family superoxide dismutase
MEELALYSNNQTKSLVMKLSTFLLAAAIFIFSCKNKDTDKTTTTTDTTQNRMDTTQNLVMDSTAKLDTMTMAMVNHAQAVISGTYPDTTVNGLASFDMDSASGKVTLKLEVTIPSKANKSVAVHIHQHGVCGNEAQMAHGHWNPTNKEHGKWGSLSFHSGDIGNIKLDNSGKGTFKLTTNLWSLGGKPDKNILRRAIIVHGGMDDYKTQPSGNSGARIGCGIIQ